MDLHLQPPYEIPLASLSPAACVRIKSRRHVAREDVE
jgi:hypothetical protein